MHKPLLIISLIASLCTGCATPPHQVPDIRADQDISLAIDTTIARDIPSSPDRLDLPANITFTSKLLQSVTDTLSAKGYRIMDSDRSVGMANPTHPYYVLTSEKQRKLYLPHGKPRFGPFYSDRLSSHQLSELYKNITKDQSGSNPAVSRMGFAGDIALLIQVRGRTIGGGRSLVAALGNIALIWLDIQNLGLTGSPDLFDVQNKYDVSIRIYRIRDGHSLWQTNFKSHNIKDVVKQTIETLRHGIPDRT